MGQAVQVTLLGQFSIAARGRVVSEWPRPTARRLCELVLVSPGRRVSRDLACDVLFPQLEPRAAARALSKALSMARSALAGLGPDGAALLSADLLHIWASPDVTVDVETRSAALRAGLAMSPGQLRDDTLSDALAEDGELLADEPYAEWAIRVRERYETLCQEARLALARDRAMGAGRAGRDDVLAAWQSCLDHDPASEEAAGALIRAYLAQGRPELAARVFERCRVALEQLGLRISPSLERLYAPARDPRSVRGAAPSVPETAQPAPSHATGTTPSAAVGLNSSAAGALNQSADGLSASATGGLTPGAAASLNPSATAGQVPPSLPREERRPVSVLFAEVAAPAGLAGAVGLETLRELVGGSLAAVITEVEALGGTVTSVSGRGLQAMFGAPQAHEDDPERAVLAAFRALTAAATAEAAAEGGTALRIGVESGPAVVGSIGGGAKVEYGAFGDVVSVAAALQSAARPGAVLVGPATRAVTGHLFSWGAGEEVSLGGNSRPLVASYLEAPRARVGERRPRGVGGRAALIGRGAEMRILETALRQAVEGHGSVVVLTGDAGLGKTRLVQECRKRFIAWVGAGSGRLPLWLEGRGASYASATPYGLYRQLVASWVGVAPDEPARLQPALGQALANLMGNANLLPPLARMMGIAYPAPSGRTSPEDLQRTTFAALRSMVTRFAVAGPTVLVLEDLHWADATSLRLTLELAELAAGLLLVLATSRPKSGREEIAALAAGPSARQIMLGPLPAAAEQTLVESLMGQVPGAIAGSGVASPEVLAAILASADGNPLFLEERLTSLLETRALVREDGTWLLRQPPGPQLPQVLERLVRSRVDRLSPAAQEAIRAAAVIGPRFTATLLAAVLGTRPAELGPALDELVDSDLVHPEPSQGHPDTFLFRHALIQEATYLGLLRAERRRLHAAAAAALEATHRDRLPEVAAVLGRYYAAADDAERAVHFLEMAGDHATDAFANYEAISSFSAALAVAQRQAPAMAADAVRLHAKLANVQWRIGRLDKAEAAFRAALELGGSVDALQRAHLHTRLGRLEMSNTQYEAAVAAFDAAEALLGDDPSGWDDATVDQWLEMMLDGRASIHSMRFEPDLMLATLERSRPLLESRGSPARRHTFHRQVTMQELIRHRFRVEDADIGRLRRSVELAEQTSDEKDVGYATYFLGWALWLRGDLTEAQQQLEKALKMGERIGERHLLLTSLLALILTALRRHDTEAVRTLIPQARTAAGKDGLYVALTVAAQAWLAWQDGRPDEVIRLAGRIAEFDLDALVTGGRYRWVNLFPLIAAQLRSGDTAAAVAAARQIVDPAQQLLPDDLMAALDAACAAWDRGEAGPAADGLADALRLAHELQFF